MNGAAGAGSQGEQGVPESLYLIGRSASLDVHDLRTFLVRNHVPFQWVDVDDNPLVGFLTNGSLPPSTVWPVCLFSDGSRLEAPSRLELARKVGLHTRPDQPEYDLAILGAGPAGLTAAVYAASEGLRTVVVEREAPGGQAGTSSRIENYPGFPEGISGMELIDRALQQSRRFGAEFVLVNHVAGFNPHRRSPFLLYLLDGTELLCHTIIVATGVSYRRLEAAGVEDMVGRGVYYGTALTEAPTYRGKEVFVVGGGNSAGQTALHLAQFARSVTLLIRGSSLEQSMSRYLIDQLEAVDTIHLWFKSQLLRAEGESHLQTLVIAREDEPVTVAADGLFILIGQRPATDWAEGVLIRDNRGFLLTGNALLEHDERCWVLPRAPLPLETNAPGVFAAGDVRHGSINRVAWAVGEGAMAVQLIHRYLADFLSSDLEFAQKLPHAAVPRIDMPTSE